MAKINGLTLKNVKKFSGMEDDCGFNADIYFGNKKIGYSSYMADGGETIVEFENKDVKEIFQKIRFLYFSKFIPINLKGVPCKNILPVEIEQIWNEKENFSDYCCSDNAAFIEVFFDLMEKEKQFKTSKKKNPNGTHLLSFKCNILLESGKLSPGYLSWTAFTNITEENLKQVAECYVVSITKKIKNDKIKVYFDKVFSVNDFTITL